MSANVHIPSEYTFHLNPIHLEGGLDLTLDGDPNNPLTIDLGLTGDPNQPVKIDLGLDDIGLSVTGDPNQPVTVDLGLDDINVCLNLALTEIPRVRVHVPTRYDFGFCLFGIRVFNFTFAGETALITEDNPPRIFRRAAPRRSANPAQDVVTAYRVNLSEEGLGAEEA